MPAPKWLRDIIDRYAATARAESWGRSDWRRVVDSDYKARTCTRAMREGLDGWQSERQKRADPAPRIPISEPQLTEETEQPIDELIQSRIGASRRAMARAKLHTRDLTLPAEPVGICVFGDPHVDNEGCDWAALSTHMEILKEADGVLAACVGDMQDNWIGRLARLYSHSSMEASDGWRLSKWMLSAVQWIAIVGGNHDAWAHGPGVDPMRWLTRECGVQCYAPDELRIRLHWQDRPDLEPVVWLLRHDFKGRSWYHPTHGPNKEAMLDGRVHLLTAGHIHQWGALTTEQRHERVTHAVRVRGYKRADEHARALGFPEQRHGEAVLVVIDPEASGPARISLHWDIERGVEYLRWLRSR